jgi:two-component system, LuxR family, response regulator FixJ
MSLSGARKSDLMDLKLELTMSLASAHQPAGFTSKPICIVDDDDGVADSLEVLLKAFGFEVQSYSSGAQFLGDERHRTAACLVIDLHMPGMSGLDVVDRLRQEGISLPTILVSGLLDAKARLRAASLGVTEIIEKPFAARRLVDLIRASIGEL